MKCIRVTDDIKCNAFAQAGKEYCFRHDPKQKETALEASRKGGENRPLKGIYGKKVELKTPDDVKNFLSEVINAVWSDSVPVQVGSSMGFLTRCWLDAYEKSDLESRVENLEKIVDDKRYG